MAQEDDLDSFLAPQAQDNTETFENTPSLARPKLKKIKRLKSRLISEALVVPEKVMPIEDDVIVNNEDVQTPSVEPNVLPNSEETLNSLYEKTNENNEIASHYSEEPPHINDEVPPHTLDEITNESPEVLPVDLDEEEANNNGALITSNEAQNITQDQFQNPYVLDGLPPDLDYEEESSEEETDYDIYKDYIAKKVLYIAVALFLCIGFLLGKALSSGKQTVIKGLENVALNDEIPRGRPRCGETDEKQACVFYIMNWYQQDLDAGQFFKLAAQLTGRDEAAIRNENMRYEYVKIKPGYIVQINIPALR